MIQFSADEIREFRSRPEKERVLSILQDELKEFLSRRLMIPETGIANWSHYYYCPDCSVELVFNPDSPLDHICPSCGKSFSDDLINGAWWRLLNSFNEAAAYRLGLVYMLSGNEEAAVKAGEILTGYAQYYPDYEVHGDIPYNGPGKMNAQTLDEANSLRNLAYAYDLVDEALTEEQRQFIKLRLFRCGIEFLKSHRHNQLHNHEVIISGAIGVLALILEDDESLSFALDAPYGLRYQLKHGVLDDGFWFECSTAYHFYALQNFLQYEKFAKNTVHSNLSDPNYVGMFEAALRIEKDDHSYPLLNDAHINQGDADGYELYEFAWKRWRIPGLLPVLLEKYRYRERLSVESFLYGEKTLPEVAKEEKKSSLEGRNGLGATVIRRGPVYLLFRHGPYGGEHDHYDRLGISYYYNNVPVAIDIGTTGYGAVLHYAYYKNTVTHNTVAIDGENQSPSSGSLISFSEDEKESSVSASVQWVDDYRLPDSFTIKQWSDEAYKGAYMERHIKVTDYGILSLFCVRLPENHVIDHMMHFQGECRSEGDSEHISEPFAKTGPLSHLHDVAKGKGGVLATSYSNCGVETSVYSFAENAELFVATGPDNPSSHDMSYVIMRTHGSSAIFLTVMSSGVGKPPVDDVRISKSDSFYTVTFILESGEEKTYTIG